MARINIPRNLPDCQLIRLLAVKGAARRDVEFDFLGKLQDFRQTVSAEVRHINELFPEYTPHDEQYHLKRLFHVADTLLGERRLEAMNSTELFLLAVAIYGHDWGMAVSAAEKQYIISGEPPEGTRPEDLWILHDDRARFAEFLSSQQLTLKADDRPLEIPIETWREYVRQTHAVRSGERARRFFDSIDGGVADAARRLCTSHWLNFEDLQDYCSYPPDFSVLRETVNLRALAVYLRLVDLLDFSEDRAPYVIWKFVAPRDPHSRMEWARHRALRPVTCREYQVGRVIQVDGSTDDHEVYAALEDLRIWCDEQLRGCNDTLARMNDPRHTLDLYHIDWRVAAQGFRPLSIRFEFDRGQMFDILSSEIYQGDPYVFLRELLQNSIDAIRMRREVVQRKGIPSEHLGEIHVTVEHMSNGDALVTWRDEGIGMDEYIVRHYLAVAGKSYYRSADFERQGFEMDPISRFGVGILSCFMVADRVEIETFKDPYLPPQGEPLRIIIPAMRQQFRIETRPQEGAQIGTTVRVFVDGRKTRATSQDNVAKPLDVTGYLSRMAGFVEFPIIVTEGNARTIILHPYKDATHARKRFGEECTVRQLDLSYPWSEAVLPQDLPIAREVFREETYDLRRDFGLQEYEGVLSYPVPIDDTTDFSGGLPGGKTTILSSSRGELIGKSVQWVANWHGRLSRRHAEMWHTIEPLADPVSSNAIYRDGILLPRASFSFPPTMSIGYLGSADATRLVVNLPKSRAARIDLARTQVLGTSESWVGPIFEAHVHRLSDVYPEHILSLPLPQRLYQLARFVVFHNVSLDRLGEIFHEDYWPMPFLEAGGNLALTLYPEVRGAPIYDTPDPIADCLAALMRNLLHQRQAEGVLTYWQGEPCLVRFSTWGGASESRIIAATLEFTRWPQGKSHQFAGIRFLTPPWDGDPPLLQEVWLPAECRDDLESAPIGEVLERIIGDPALMNVAEMRVLRKAMQPSIGDYFDRCKLAKFPPPFNRSFAYGNRALNLEHPAVQALVRLVAQAVLLNMRGDISMSKLNHLEHIMRTVFYDLPGAIHHTTHKNWAKQLYDLWLLASDMQLIHVSEPERLVPDLDEFVPGSHSPFLNVRVRDDWNKPFGQLLS